MVLADGLDEILLTRQSFAMKVVDTMAKEFIGLALSVAVSDGSSLTIDSFSSESTNPTASITLPPEVVIGVTSDNARIVFQTFLQDSFYQSLDSVSYAESEVNSIILGAGVFSNGDAVDVRRLSDPVKLQFIKLRTPVS